MLILLKHLVLTIRDYRLIVFILPLVLLRANGGLLEFAEQLGISFS